MCVLPPLVPIVSPQISHFPSLFSSADECCSFIVQPLYLQSLVCSKNGPTDHSFHEAACELDSVAPHFVQSLACNLFEPTYQLPNVCWQIFSSAFISSPVFAKAFIFNTEATITVKEININAIVVIVRICFLFNSFKFIILPLILFFHGLFNTIFYFN